MLDRTTNKVFKYIYKNPKNQSISKLQKKFNNFPTLLECYDVLIKQELIINRNGSIQITIKGQDFYYNYWKNKILKIIQIFIIPIAIAVISSLFTAHLISSSNDCNCSCNIIK